MTFELKSKKDITCEKKSTKKPCQKEEALNPIYRQIWDINFIDTVGLAQLNRGEGIEAQTVSP